MTDTGTRRPRTRRATGRRVLLASEGRRFTDDVIDRAFESAGADGRVRVLTIARVWGTGLGLPHPGLKPNKRELAEHEDNVAYAIRRLKGAGILADGHIVATRRPGKAILAELTRHGSKVVVMGADPPRGWLLRDLLWDQEPHRVWRRCPVPVHLVGQDGSESVAPRS